MATALELGPEGWKPYIEALRNRPEPVLSPEQVAERDALIAKAREAAAMLKEKYGAKRVWLFGSLVHQAWYDEASDGDLAVEGLREGSFYNAWREAEHFLIGRIPDFITVETVSQNMRLAIERDGMAL